ncbi:MAG: DUF1732 domain-containing protein [Candidatus Cloacimonadaceae bacterium]|jgi:uncharacterized protein (TIGR00255 family)|nr:DUF1732 domain-containing protein [Candidatus Cloacimonadota bacterium]MDX9949598.1 DUF1732 domain-containing protein [Candidatus Syntrophosphaera sp.]NLN85508.1 DUF1732 domain-containing protein [Candidatus Cloacimonadota bacterium]
MKSMTGHGLAKTHAEEIDIEIELRSINGRYLDLRLYLPRELNFFEYPLRKRLSEALGRGTVEVRVSFNDHREPRLKLNLPKLRKFKAIVQEAGKMLEIDGNVPLEFYLDEPGIIESTNDLDEDELLKELLNKTMDEAISKLLESLHSEASGIREVIALSCDKMLQALDMVENEIQPYKEELFKEMKARTAELLNTVTHENLEQRLFQELAVYIDRYDIHEELSRLRSHISTLLEVLQKKDDNGKSLNFVLQEMQREANTLGSKFSTAKTFAHILVLKEEVEKCREIVQNVA